MALSNLVICYIQELSIELHALISGTQPFYLYLNSPTIYSIPHTYRNAPRDILELPVRRA